MAGKDYQIKLLLQALDNASPAIRDAIKSVKALEKVKDDAERKELLRNRSRLAKAKYTELEIKNSRAKVNAKYAEMRAEETHATKVASANKKIKESTKIRLDQEKKLSDIRTKALKDEKLELFNHKKKINNIKEQTAAKKSLLDVKVKENQLETSNARTLVARDRADSYFANKSQRERENAIRNQRRQQLQRYTDLSHAQESARAAMMYVSTPTTANAAFAVRNAMTMEQLGIRMRTQFGKEEGMMAFEEMKNYAAQTAFRLQEAVQLLSGMKVGQKGLGITSTKELVEKSKSIGNVLLAFASSPEGRGEIAYQLSQVAMKRKANMRQDLMVMANYGLPIFEILEKYTGKSVEDLKKQYGAELPAELIFKVLDELAKSPQVFQAMKDRTDSLSQSWDTLKERVFFTSSVYGEILDKQLGIKDTFKEASEVLKKMEENMKGVSNESLSTKEKMIGFTTAMVIGVPTLTFMLLTFKKLFSVASQTAGSTSALYKNLSLAAGVVSAAYLYTVDWEQVIKDIDKNGLKGLLKHMDVLIAGAQIFATLMMFAFPGGFLAKGAGKLFKGVSHFLKRSTLTQGAIVAGAGYGGYKTVEGFRDYVNKVLNQGRTEEAINSLGESIPNNMSTPNGQALQTIYNAATIPQMSTPQQPITLQIENNFKYDDKGKITSSQSSVKRNTNNNPISVIWE